MTTEQIRAAAKAAHEALCATPEYRRYAEVKATAARLEDEAKEAHAHRDEDQDRYRDAAVAADLARREAAALWSLVYASPEQAAWARATDRVYGANAGMVDPQETGGAP